MNFLKINSLPLFLLLTSLLLSLFPEFSKAYLRYERNGIIDGELWRLLSAHLVHAGWEHLWLNIFALIIIWVMFRNFLSISLWWLFTLLSGLYISISFFIFMNQLEWYVGLSGVLHSMLVFGFIGCIGCIFYTVTIFIPEPVYLILSGCGNFRLPYTVSRIKI